LAQQKLWFFETPAVLDFPPHDFAEARDKNYSILMPMQKCGPNTSKIYFRINLNHLL
jgi:hypothetical protein